MEPFKFVHAADLHLGSPFAGVTARAPEIAEALKEASITAFHNLIDCVLDNNAKFLLIAGDLFDLDAPSLKARLEFAGGMKRLNDSGIPVFVVYGNHDPVSHGLKGVALPGNVRVFGASKVETAKVSAHGETLALVSGISYSKREESRNLAAMFPVFGISPFSVGMVHANVGKVGGYADYAACVTRDLEKSGVRYFALGHVHERRRVSDSPLAAYPGNIQGRSFRETGPRGALVVSVDAAGNAAETFVALDSVRFHEAELDVSPMENVNELADEMVSKVRSLAAEAGGRGLVCRLGLSGRSRLYPELAAPGALDDLLAVTRETFSEAVPFIWVEEIASRVLPEIDFKERLAEGGIFAQVLAIAGEWREGGMDEARKALSGLFSNNRTRDAFPDLSESETAELLDGAVLLCMDFLEGSAK